MKRNRQQQVALFYILFHLGTARHPQRHNDTMSRIVKAIRSAIRPSEEPEIVAVVPPPADPKRSLPPPASPTLKAQISPPQSPPHRQPTPPLSPVVNKLETTTITEQAPAVINASPEVIVELPDTSITRPRSPKAVEKEPRLNKVPVPGNEPVPREKKKKDPAVLVEIPMSPSPQAYEVAHSHKLQDQYFNPIYEDDSRTPQEGAKSDPMPPEKLAETLKSAATDPISA
ncbi:hypothetical protein BDZ91DRAFT_847522 [Kalaharituber pfeilii]|nr:hypothetical protein BDZ91DRAFT_847522 [Kalaharituber pfeilii]